VWTALFETPDSDCTALVVGNGARHFGLTVPQVTSAIMALPGSNRCERFAGWLDGDNPPPPPPLNTEEERKRLAYEAAACRLPEGVVGISAATTKPGTCYVCFEEEEDEEDLILQCDGCGIFTHMTCYGVPEPPHGHLWLCDTCKVGAAFPPSCALCPIVGGALKRTDCGRWVHPSCVIWLPENTFLNRELSYHNLQGLVTGLSSVHPSRRKLLCQVCKMPHGACMQCCEPGCYAAFHIMCARQTEGYALQLLADSEDEDEGGAEEDGGKIVEVGDDGAALPTTIVDTIETLDGDDMIGTLPSTSGSGDENKPAVANGGAVAIDMVNANGGAAAAAAADGGGGVCNVVLDAAAQVGKKRGRPGPPPGVKKQKKKLKYKMVRGKRRAFVAEGTKINGARLVVYCPKHCPEGYVQPAIIPALEKVVKTAAREHLNTKNQQQTATNATAAAGTTTAAVANILLTSENDAGNASGRSSAAGWPLITTPSGIKRRASLLLSKVIDEALLEKASAAVGGWPVPPPNTLYSSRAMPFDGSLGRGPRAPEAMEAALAKRYYIEATPLLVRGPVPGSLDPPKSTCTWHTLGNTPGGTANDTGSIGAVDGSVGAGFVVDTAGAVACVKATPMMPAAAKVNEKVTLPGSQMIIGVGGNADEEDEDIEIMGVSKAETHLVVQSPAAEPLEPLPQQQQQQQQPSSVEAELDTAFPGVNDATKPQEEEDIMSKPDISLNAFTIVKTATAPRITPDRKTVLSSTDRYREMRATEGLRIAPGKSAIHGWGAFARLPHAKDQMVIEYVGDLVRPSVADARERQVYDSLVGAGTYVFRVNMDQCVDATRSGNLAHLLNHSCEPNCYSRTVPVWDGQKGAAVDHVVIFAAREIATWEELTYDYRFSGEEKLVCNCGAGRCRGMVNQASTGPGGGVAVKGTLVPKSKVKFPFRI
jgi:hypothetical protein